MFPLPCFLFFPCNFSFWGSVEDTSSLVLWCGPLSRSRWPLHAVSYFVSLSSCFLSTDHRSSSLIRLGFIIILLVRILLRCALDSLLHPIIRCLMSGCPVCKHEMLRLEPGVRWCQGILPSWSFPTTFHRMVTAYMKWAVFNQATWAPKITNHWFKDFPNSFSVPGPPEKWRSCSATKGCVPLGGFIGQPYLGFIFFLLLNRHGQDDL